MCVPVHGWCVRVRGYFSFTHFLSTGQVPLHFLWFLGQDRKEKRETKFLRSRFHFSLSRTQSLIDREAVAASQSWTGKGNRYRSLIFFYLYFLWSQDWSSITANAARNAWSWLQKIKKRKCLGRLDVNWPGQSTPPLASLLRPVDGHAQGKRKRKNIKDRLVVLDGPRTVIDDSVDSLIIKGIY